MFMVAASVVTTILVLNYHHRQADTHEMPEWVSYSCILFLFGILSFGHQNLVHIFNNRGATHQGIIRCHEHSEVSNTFFSF